MKLVLNSSAKIAQRGVRPGRVVEELSQVKAELKELKTWQTLIDLTRRVAKPEDEF